MNVASAMQFCSVLCFIPHLQCYRTTTFCLDDFVDLIRFSYQVSGIDKAHIFNQAESFLLSFGTSIVQSSSVTSGTRCCQAWWSQAIMLYSNNPGSIHFYSPFELLPRTNISRTVPMPSFPLLARTVVRLCV